MKTLSRLGYLTLLGGLVALPLGRALLSRMARPRPWFTYSMKPVDQAAYDGLAARAGWAKSKLVTPDGVTLSGLISGASEPAAPWVLFFPGNDANQLARSQLVLERIRANHPWGLAVYASRGYEPSQGTPSPTAYAADASQVLATLRRENGLEPSQIHLVAFSLGGYSALHAFNNAAKLNQKPATLSLFASVARVGMVHSDFFAKFGAGDVFDVLPILPNVPGPVLAIEGDADEAYGSLPQAPLLAAALGARGRLLELKGAGHNSLLDNEQAISAVRAVIEAHASLSPAAAKTLHAPALATEASRP